MSSGGSNPSSPTGATGDQPTTATINSPIAKGPNAPEAPGGKGWFPSAQNPYAQQQPQIYTPPQQQSFYDQAFNHPYYQQPPQYYQQQPQYYQQAPQYYQQQPQYYQSQPQINSYGLGSFSGGMGNAYARRPRFSPPSPFNGGRMSPIEAQPPMDEMQMGVMGGGFQQSRSLGPYTGGFGNNVPEPMRIDDYKPSGPPPPQGMMVNPNYGKPGQDYYISKKTSDDDFLREYLKRDEERIKGDAADQMRRLAQIKAGGLGSMNGLLGQLSPDDPMYGMPSAPPSMPVNEAGRDMNQAFNEYQKQIQDWQNKTGMTPDQWYAKRDEGIAFRNKQAAQSPVATLPISQAGQAVSTGPRTGLGALLGGV